jgi:hypothetical protein
MQASSVGPKVLQTCEHKLGLSRFSRIEVETQAYSGWTCDAAARLENVSPLQRRILAIIHRQT